MLGKIKRDFCKKPVLTTLNILTFAITIGNLKNILHTILQKDNISTNNYSVAKTQQDTKYIDKFGKNNN
ncbi:hypothetical protein [Spiroplasma endosymbiont of Polydrusus pterygomalis]|uniref:hypothetical protein n=1 Tax=Spiroplasma endosymbiont of Polydrusus pterygomalis TaxID=3139327 RepID=UPI003CCABB08